MARHREIVIANRQRRRRLDRKVLLRFCEWAGRDLDEFELGLHFVSPREMARVHEEFMNISGSTDVITFDHGSEPPRKVHGEAFISVQDAEEQAAEFKTSWQAEIARYIIHAILHLLGYDDMTPAARVEMKKLENRMLKQAAREFDFRDFEKR